MKAFKLILLLVLIGISSDAISSTVYAQKVISAQNTFSDPVKLTKAYGGILTLTGTWSGTVTLQRATILGTYVDVTDANGNIVGFTTNGTYLIQESTSSAMYKFGVKTGNYTSGTVTGVLESQ